MEELEGDQGHMEELEPIVLLFMEEAGAAGFEVAVGDVPDIEGAEVSHALYGIAATGSVVLRASPEEPRARSLLPDVHISILPTHRIVADLAELMERIRDDLPSALAIVTGPSRSRDIEQRLAIGVHGPGRVCVVLVPPGELLSPEA
jgi:L-lactate dehydrogenase complex protein LldG